MELERSTYKIRASYDVKTDGYALTFLGERDGTITHWGELVMRPVEPGMVRPPTVLIEGSTHALDFVEALLGAIHTLGLPTHLKRAGSEEASAEAKLIDRLQAETRENIAEVRRVMKEVERLEGEIADLKGRIATASA